MDKLTHRPNSVNTFLPPNRDAEKLLIAIAVRYPSAARFDEAARLLVAPEHIELLQAAKALPFTGDYSTDSMLLVSSCRPDLRPLASEIYGVVGTPDVWEYTCEKLRQWRHDHDLLTYASEISTACTSKDLASLRSLIDSASRLSSASPLSLLRACRFDLDNPPPQPEPIFRVCGKTVCTPGNLSAIIALPKDGKTALMGAFLAATMGSVGDTLGVTGLNTAGLAVVHFDTEQSPADHHHSIKVAGWRIGKRVIPPWLRSYTLVEIPLTERFGLLEAELVQAHADHGGIHSVFIDGIGDFVRSPMDEEESNNAVERLHRMAVKYRTTIVSVLHINPGSEIAKTRGHLGSQLDRKAETVLRLDRGEDGVTTVSTKHGRHCFISKEEGPRFQWSDESAMHVTITAPIVPISETENLRRIADEVFDRHYSYSAALNRIQQIAGVKERKAKAIFSRMNTAKIIEKNVINNWEKTGARD